MSYPAPRPRTISKADVDHVLRCVWLIDEAGAQILTAMPDNAVVADAVGVIKDACSGLNQTFDDLPSAPATQLELHTEDATPAAEARAPRSPVVTSGGRPGDRETGLHLECVLWALVRGTERAEARTRRHERGIELYVAVDGEPRQARVFSLVEVAELETFEMELRQAYVLDGWEPAGPHR